MAGIYVHIPFCHAKCFYCDFFSTPRIGRSEEVVNGILDEFARRRSELGGEDIRTVYFGGGTPSCLPHRLLERICEALPMSEAVERTIEVNPEDVSAESAGRWIELGFNRVSMGVQSLVDSELTGVGRRHSAAGALAAVATLRSAGFANISCDLIYGLPGQSLDTWRYSLSTLLACGIEHLSAYSLGYEPGTRLTAMLRAGRVEAVSDDTVAEMYAVLCDMARAASLEHYEISNFGRPGRHSMHNSAYWDGTPYLGLGPGAHSLSSDGVRRASAPDIGRWLDEGAVAEDESATDRINDVLITALRTSAGLDLRRLPDDAADAVIGSAGPYIAKGWLTETHGLLRIPEMHWLVSDAILRDLML